MAQKIALTSENEEFLARIVEISGQEILACEQCGTCSAGCPMIGAMDVTPSQMMRMIQLGQREVMETKAMWLCASCYTCTVRCPRGLDLSKVAEAARQLTLREGVDRIDIGKIPEEDKKRLPAIAVISSLRKMTG
jgi:heterodisulfide reductase subunit C